MTIALTYGSTTIELPTDLQWRDEFAWNPVEQSADYSLTGALVIQEGVKYGGRPITLFGGEDTAWVTRATVTALFQSTAVAGRKMTLTYHDRVFTVMWRRPQPIEATEIRRVANPGPTDWYNITINLMEVQA